MPGANSLAKGVRCPFWQSSDGHTHIICESSFDRSCLAIFFTDPEACRRYRREICSGPFEDCPLYQGLLATKYKEE